MTKKALSSSVAEMSWTAHVASGADTPSIFFQGFTVWTPLPFHCANMQLGQLTATGGMHSQSRVDYDTAGMHSQSRVD